MLSTENLIDLERKTLNRYAKERSGAELAEFVAKRTRKFLVQEIVNHINRYWGAKNIAKDIQTIFEELS